MGGASTEVRRKGETKAEMFERFGMDSKVPPDPQVPDEVAHVVGWFFELSNKRGSGMSGGLPLSWTDIAAWSELLNTYPTEEEVRMILAMDSAFLTACNKDDDDLSEEPPTSKLLRK